MELLDFPVEFIVLLCHFLPDFDVLSFYSVCKQLRGLCDQKKLMDIRESILVNSDAVQRVVVKGAPCCFYNRYPLHVVLRRMSVTPDVEWSCIMKRSYTIKEVSGNIFTIAAKMGDMVSLKILFKMVGGSLETIWPKDTEQTLKEVIRSCYINNLAHVAEWLVATFPVYGSKKYLEQLSETGHVDFLM